MRSPTTPLQLAAGFPQILSTSAQKFFYGHDLGDAVNGARIVERAPFEVVEDDLAQPQIGVLVLLDEM